MLNPEGMKGPEGNSVPGKAAVEELSRPASSPRNARQSLRACSVPEMLGTLSLAKTLFLCVTATGKSVLCVNLHFVDLYSIVYYFFPLLAKGHIRSSSDSFIIPAIRKLMVYVSHIKFSLPVILAIKKEVEEMKDHILCALSKCISLLIYIQYLLCLEYCARIVENIR